MPNGNSRSMQVRKPLHTTTCSSTCLVIVLTALVLVVQWFSFYSNFTAKRLGLYVAAHDASSHLQLAMSTGNWPGGASLHWYHIPSNPLAPLGEQPWEMNYEVILQGFEGDWYDAAQIYREWALGSAKWTRKGDVATRLRNKQFPEYLLRPIYMEYLYVEFVCKCIYVYFTYILDGAGTSRPRPC